MESIDLFGLREHFNRSRILLCFNGPISRSLIEEIGNALKNYLQADSALPSAAMDVFSAYVEMTQNIRHYALAQGYDELDSSATIVVARDGEGAMWYRPAIWSKCATARRCCNDSTNWRKWTRHSSKSLIKPSCASRATKMPRAAPAWA